MTDVFALDHPANLCRIHTQIAGMTRDLENLADEACEIAEEMRGSTDLAIANCTPEQHVELLESAADAVVSLDDAIRKVLRAIRVPEEVITIVSNRFRQSYVMTTGLRDTLQARIDADFEEKVLRTADTQGYYEISEEELLRILGVESITVINLPDLSRP